MLDKLLTNAVEHTGADGEIRVAVRRAEEGWLELSVENRLPEAGPEPARVETPDPGLQPPEVSHRSVDQPPQ
jgi:signal transduction histidine kinase